MPSRAFPSASVNCTNTGYAVLSLGGSTECYGVDSGQAATAQLAAGTQTYLEVQSLRSWAGAGGDNFRRDTLYLRAISPYWPRNIFPP